MGSGREGEGVKKCAPWWICASFSLSSWRWVNTSPLFQDISLILRQRHYLSTPCFPIGPRQHCYQQHCITRSTSCQGPCNRR